MALAEFHPVARCRWCGGRFRRVWTVQWLCETEACSERQLKHAMRREEAPDGESPYLYLPTPAQVELRESAVKNLLWGGAAGGSKSHGLRWDAYHWCLTIPGYEALILRRTYPELETTHILRMQREAVSLGAKFVAKDRMVLFENGSFLRAGHCEAKSDMTKHLSTEWDDIRFDEGTTFERDVILEISSRARSNKPAVEDRGGAFVRLGSNPGGIGAAFLKEFFIDRDPDPQEYPKYRPDHYAFIQAKVTDNPYLDPDYTSRLEQLGDARQQQLLDGNWDVFGSQFFPSYSAETHILDWDAKLTGSEPVIAGCYWRFNAPGAFVFGRILPNGRIYVQADLKFQQETIADVAQQVIALADQQGLRLKVIHADPEMFNDERPQDLRKPPVVRTESPASLFSRAGLNLLASDPHERHGWQRVHDYFRPAPDGKPWLIISPRCKMLVRTLPTLVQDEHDPDVCVGVDYGAVALRFMLAARPTPSSVAVPQTAPAPFTLGWLKRLDAPARSRRGVLARG